MIQPKQSENSLKLETDSNFSFCETPTPNKSLTLIEENKVNFQFGGNLSNLFSIPISNNKKDFEKNNKNTEKKEEIFCRGDSGNRLFSNDYSDFSVSSFPRELEPYFEDNCILKRYYKIQNNRI